MKYWLIYPYFMVYEKIPIWLLCSLILHTGIKTDIYHFKLTVHVGKYTSPMDP